tara:strand:+ start:259 stop:465 length:207 start_codon:yes stop_codon:yes gene_type:complete
MVETRDYMITQFTVQVGRRDRLMADRQTIISTDEMTREEWRAEFNNVSIIVEYLREQIRTIEEYIRPN